MIIATPAVVIAYVAMKMPQYLRPVGTIFGLAASAGIITFVVFGMVGPDPYLLAEEPVSPEEGEEQEIPTEGLGAAQQGPAEADVSISILEGSAEQGNPDYDPDVATVSQGQVVEWTNEDSVQHTVTNSDDPFGEIFNSGLMDPEDIFVLDTTDLEIGEYTYVCVVHPWMESTLVIEEAKGSDDTKEGVSGEDSGNGNEGKTVSIPQGAGIQKPDQLYYDPDSLTIPIGTTVTWSNDDNTIHTVTEGSPDVGQISDGFDSDLIGPGESFEYTFEEAGTFDYYCIVHPWMIGNVDVIAE